MDVDEGSHMSEKSSVGIDLKQASSVEEVKSVPIEKKAEQISTASGRSSENEKTMQQNVVKKLIMQMKNGCSKTVCF